MREAPEGSAKADLLLVRRVQAGEQKAFDLLVRKYQNRVLQLVYRFVKDHDEAQDVAQEAFIKAYRAIGKFRGDSAFYTWLYRISVNTAKNYLMAQKRRPPRTDVDANDPEQFTTPAPLRELATPENEAFSDELQVIIADVVAKLPDDLRMALELRELEGLSYMEIAEVMDCPVGTVRSRIFRARESVDEVLSDYRNG